MSELLETLDVISVKSSKPYTVKSDASNGSDLYKSEPCNPLVQSATNEICTVPSQSTERCPVTWTGESKKLKHNSFYDTPSSQTKVVNWLKTHVKQDKPPTVLRKSSILLQHDFGKGTNRVSQKHNVFHIDTLAREHFPGRNKFEIVNGSAKKGIEAQTNATPVSLVSSHKCLNIFVNNTIAKDVSGDGYVQTQSTAFENAKIEPKDSPSSPDNNLLKNSDSKDASKTLSNEIEAVENGKPNVPLSPESLHKKELCSYLQLMNMNPGDKKEAKSIQNRRSTRVKNHLLMTEKRNLERLLNSETESSRSDSCLGKSLCQKSFSELNVSVETVVSPVSENTGTVKFVDAIPKRLLQRKQTFDGCMKKFFASNKGLLKAKKLRVKAEAKKQRLKRWLSKNSGVTHVNCTPKVRLTRSHDSKEQIKKTINKLFRKPHLLKKKKKKKLLKQNVKLKTTKATSKTVLHKRRLRINTVLRSTRTSKNASLKTASKDVKRKALKTKKKTAVNEQNVEVQAKEATQDENENCKSPSNLLNFVYKDLGEGKNANLTPERIESIIGIKINSPKPTTDSPPCPGFTQLDITEKKLRNKNTIVLFEHFKKLADQKRVSINGVSDKLNDVNVTMETTAPTPTVNGLAESDLDAIVPQKSEFIRLNPHVPPKSLHRSLMYHSKEPKTADLNGDADLPSPQNWDMCSNSTPSVKNSKQRIGGTSHSIAIRGENGAVIKVHYANCNLVVAQERTVSVWTQSALGHVLGAQNMWVSRGSVDRLVLGNGCASRNSAEMVVNLEDSVAYVELWSKEHKSDKRERPVADVFATVYYWRQRQNGVHRKVLQLENINGFASDVQYVVLNRSRNVIVSWHCVTEDSKLTVVHCYHLAPDYQTVATIRELQKVEHYVSSLHNIDDCDNLVMGCGENNVTLWNLEYGYVVATVSLSEVNSSPVASVPDTLWVKCDRGFLFMLRRWSSNEKMCLIAINGISQSWKRLQIYVPSVHCKGLKGVCIENGILVAFYENAVLAWNVETGELIGEEGPPEGVVCMPSRKHVVMITDEDKVCVRHALAYLVTNYEA